MPTFTIDGKTVPFEPGDTILRAAYRAGIDIPYYCWHPGLSVAANCRMCLVEILPPPGRKPMMLDVLELDPSTGQYVKVQKPKLQPACQVPASENLQVLSDTSPHVLRARHAVQELLLLNHPVDCPICDQAGNCKLQDYWMKHMKSSKRMCDEPVHKPKAVSFGPTIIYDAERCILCTRCVRFCREVAKDPVLSLRERGNVNEINLSPGRQLDHPYSLMVEQVCPVGAMTSKDFRFKARVWFLRSAKVVCQGCATGCNAWLDYDPRCQKAYRHRPRCNEKVNGHWMCDEGMLSYRTIEERRVTEAKSGSKACGVDGVIAKIAAMFKQLAVDKVAVVLSASHSCEDNFALARFGVSAGVSKWFIAAKPDGEGDQVLRHRDKNSNRRGVELVAEALGISLEPVERLTDALTDGVSVVMWLGDEGTLSGTLPKTLATNATLVVLASQSSAVTERASVLVPTSGWAEASGVYVNHAGLGQASEAALLPRGEAQPAWRVVGRLAAELGHAKRWTKLAQLRGLMQEAEVLANVLVQAGVVEQAKQAASDVAASQAPIGNNPEVAQAVAAPQGG